MHYKLFWIALAGATGTLCRYGLAGVVQRATGASFPWGTVAVNLTGCFIAGLAWMLFEHRLQVSGEIRIIVMVGFMGGFTTFSAYMLETSELMRTAEYLHAVGNMAIQNGLGFVALMAGIAVGRLL